MYEYVSNYTTSTNYIIHKPNKEENFNSIKIHSISLVVFLKRLFILCKYVLSHIGQENCKKSLTGEIQFLHLANAQHSAFTVNKTKSSSLERVFKI